MATTIAPPQDIPSHAAALMRWHGLTEAHIPSVTEALRSWDLPELDITGEQVRGAWLSLQDVEAASCAMIRAASS